jgi:hypothetical protein
MGALVQPLLTHFKRRQKVAETPLGRFNYKLTGWHKGIVGIVMLAATGACQFKAQDSSL